MVLWLPAYFLRHISKSKEVGKLIVNLWQPLCDSAHLKLYGVFHVMQRSVRLDKVRVTDTSITFSIKTPSRSIYLHSYITPLNVRCKEHIRKMCEFWDGMNFTGLFLSVFRKMTTVKRHSESKRSIQERCTNWTTKLHNYAEHNLSWKLTATHFVNKLSCSDPTDSSSRLTSLRSTLKLSFLGVSSGLFPFRLKFCTHLSCHMCAAMNRSWFDKHIKIRYIQLHFHSNVPFWHKYLPKFVDRSLTTLRMEEIVQEKDTCK